MRPTVTCGMDFTWYPFDEHNCEILFQTMKGHEMDLKTLIEGPEFGYFMMQNAILDYSVTFDSLPLDSTSRSFTTSEDQLCMSKYIVCVPKKMKEEWKSMGTVYSMTGFVIKLRRKWTKQILVYYFPSALFVFSSWVSFLIPPTVSLGE